jgi:2-polyprenyl-6-methoxyphenol hydroxylase-like FAD-dependent oxidoreductase
MQITQDEDWVHTVVRERTAGTEYAIGADGGRSTVAEQLGFPLEGRMGLGASMNIWLEAARQRPVSVADLRPLKPGDLAHHEQVRSASPRARYTRSPH